VIHTLTPETAAIERARILADVRWHRQAAARRLRDLERLEADCQRVGIRLIREPRQTHKGETNHAGASPYPR
jgi:hypothetical protein